MSDDDARTSAKATRVHIDRMAEHIERLAEKRDRLVAASVEAFAAILLAVARGEWTPAESLAWWEWARTLTIPRAGTRCAEALGVEVATLKRWRRHLPDGSPESLGLIGTWPILHQLTPAKGTPCVYLLLAGDGSCLYVGQTLDARTRLNMHKWQARMPLASWRAFICKSVEEALEVEGDLIYQHQPPYNSKGRAARYRAPAR
jgi:hypothetical protein